MTQSVIGVMSPAIAPIAAGLLTLAVLVLAWRLHRPRGRRPLVERVDEDRGAVHLTDVVVTLGVLTTIMVLAPTLYKFIDMVTGASGPLTTLLLSLAVPVLFIALILSIGRQGRRGGA